jgi:hypothetical protein
MNKFEEEHKEAKEELLKIYNIDYLSKRWKYNF